MKGTYIKTTIQEVYKNISDKEAGIPPLFKFSAEIFDIDESKVDRIESVEVNYKTK